MTSSSLGVLIVDDNDFRAEISADFLTTLNPEVAVTVVEDYEAFQKAIETKRWALCVLDGEFPENATSQIQHNEKPLGMKALAALEERGYSQDNVVVLSGNDIMVKHSTDLGYSAATVDLAEASVRLRLMGILSP